MLSVTSSSEVSVVTTADAIRAYVLDYSRRGASAKTMLNAFIDLKRFDTDVRHELSVAELPVSSLSRAIIEAHLARFGRGLEKQCTRVPSVHTVERRRRVIKAFVRWMVREQYVPEDVTKRLTPVPLRERFPSVWDIEDVERFLQSFQKETIYGHRDHTLALVALSSGLRAGELALLRPVDIDIRSLTLRVSDKGKTGARTAILTSDATRDLQLWLRRRERDTTLLPTDPLFPSIGISGIASREPLTPQSISCIIARHAKASGIKNVKLGAHALRHTAASHLARNGASAFEIKQFLGHSSITMSQRYVSMSNASVQRRVEESGILSQVNTGDKNKQSDVAKDDLLRKLRRGR